jgi:hypothetical protein
MERLRFEEEERTAIDKWAAELEGLDGTEWLDGMVAAGVWVDRLAPVQPPPVAGPGQ